MGQICHIECHGKPISFLFLYIKFCVVYTHFTYVALKFHAVFWKNDFEIEKILKDEILLNTGKRTIYYFKATEIYYYMQMIAASENV